MALTLQNLTLFSLLQLQPTKLPITNQEKAALGYPEDNLLDFTEIAKKYGYNSSGYSVTTQDGYILKLYNIVNPICETYVEPPVLLMHGLLLSSDIWLDAGPNVSLAYLLADQCYDLWVGNVRGNYLGRDHVSLDPVIDAEFWDFSFDDMGLYDAPAIIDFVLNKTGSKKLNYIGSSQGGGMFAIMCSERPEYVKKVKSFVALAPATRVTYTKSKVFRRVSELCVALYKLGVVEIFFKGSGIQEALEVLCQKEASYVPCSLVLSTIDSAHPGSIHERTIKRLFAHAPAGTSVKNFVRYAQGFHSDKFQKFDYGKEENLKIYGNETAPEYDLSGITIPALIIIGLNDKFVDVKDVMWLQDQMPNASLKIVVDPLWNHFDDYFSKIIPELLFPEVHKHLMKHCYHKC